MFFDKDDLENAKAISDALGGPAMIATKIRESLFVCWLSLPPQRRSIDELEKTFSMILKREIDNMKADNEFFER